MTILTAILFTVLGGCRAPGGNDSKRNQSNAQTPRPTETPYQIYPTDLAGTLKIVADEPSRPSDSSITKKGWLFIKGQLIGRLPIHQDRMLVPGNYEVRAVVVAESAVGVSYWTVSWPEITIEKGRTVTLNAKEAIDDFTSNNIAQQGINYTRSPEPLKQARYITLNQFTDGLLSEASNDLPKEWQSFLDSPEWKVVSSTADRLRISPPSRQRVWMEMPNELGGSREFDAEQIRILAKRLSPYLGGWGSPTVSVDTYSPPSPYDQQRLRTKIDQLAAFVHERQDWVQKNVDGMIKQLEQAPEK